MNLDLVIYSMYKEAEKLQPVSQEMAENLRLAAKMIQFSFMPRERRCEECMGPLILEQPFCPQGEDAKLGDEGVWHCLNPDCNNREVH